MGNDAFRGRPGDPADGCRLLRELIHDRKGSFGRGDRTDSPAERIANARRRAWLPMFWMLYYMLQIRRGAGCAGLEAGARRVSVAETYFWR